MTTTDINILGEFAAISIRIPVGLQEQLRRKAALSCRSLNAQVVWELIESCRTPALSVGTSTWRIPCKTMQVRMPAELRGRLENSARKAGRTLHNECITRLTCQLAAIATTRLEAADGEYTRSNALEALASGVEALRARGGGVVAVVAGSGYGKTVLASQFLRHSRHAAGYFCVEQPTVGVPDTTGVEVALIDEPQLFLGLRRFVEKPGLVWIALCQKEQQVHDYFGETDVHVVRLSPWTEERPAGWQAAPVMA